MSLFIDNMYVEVEGTNEPSKKPLKLIHEFSNVSGYVSILKSIAFPIFNCIKGQGEFRKKQLQLK